jgi:hypothetical protein
VFYIGPRDGGGAFGTKCHAPAAQIFEGVHLLAHDIRRVTDAPSEEPGIFESGGIYPVVAISAKDCLGRSDDPAADGLLLGKDVVRPFRCGERLSHGPSGLPGTDCEQAPRPE